MQSRLILLANVSKFASITQLLYRSVGAVVEIQDVLVISQPPNLGWNIVGPDVQAQGNMPVVLSLPDLKQLKFLSHVAFRALSLLSVPVRSRVIRLLSLLRSVS